MWHRYRLLTRWRVAAPPEPVWDAILHSERWPRWWPALEQVCELAPGDDAGIGNRRGYTWRTPLGYRLRFTLQTTRIEPRRLLEGAARRDVRGCGRWRFAGGPGASEALYQWDVEPTRAWLRALSVVAHPLLVWSHHHLMRQGADGLGRALGCRVECESLPAALGKPPAARGLHRQANDDGKRERKNKKR